QFDWLHFECIDANPTTAPVGGYLANNFGLHDMLGNVWEWVEDCWNDSYAGAPADGQPRLKGDCKRHVVRGGSWKNVFWATRSAFRGWQGENDKTNANGFRVARFSQ
ncbi:MAG: formylglycine-generating enzyme family protein, partial [Alphaproteobacteria bacterium]